MLAVTIGNFDGVHRGHQALVKRARHAAGPDGRVVAVTFEPHPMARLRPEALPPRLTAPADRRRLLLAAGADDVLELDPTPELLALAPEEFIDRLRERLPFAVIVEGPDFRFGRGRAGSIESLRSLAAGRFAVDEVPPVDAVLPDGLVVRASSTTVRWFLALGRVREANAILGRPHGLAAVSVPGERRGRTIGFPTLNLAPAAAHSPMLPGDGVYAGVVTLAGAAPGQPERSALAAISIGIKPTFGGAVRVCEAHLLDVSLPMDQYGVELRLTFAAWIRDQLRFGSAEELVQRLRRDVATVRERLERSGAAGPVAEPSAGVPIAGSVA